MAKRFFFVCAGLLCLAVAGCNNHKITLPPLESIYGTWSNGRLTLVVGGDQLWQLTGEVRYRCTISDYTSTCKYQADVVGFVQHSTPIGIKSYGRDAEGNIVTVRGWWDNAITSLKGSISVAPATGVGGTDYFAMVKVGP